MSQLDTVSSTQFGTTVPATAYKDGDTIAWRARAYDGLDRSEWSPWCDATVDQTGPDKPPVMCRG